MAKQPRKRSKPQKSSEPTVSQQRQAYYEARARRASLTELGLLDAERARPAADKRAALEALDAFDRLMVLYGVSRWAAMTGEPPEPEDWEGDKDWPQPDAVDALFGSWDDALAESGVLDSAIPVLLDKVAKTHQELVKQGDELEKRAKRLEDEAQKVPELERQMKGHKSRRDEADLRVRELEGERDRLAAERDDARGRAAALEAKAGAAPAPAPAPADPEADALRAELAAARDEVDRAHAELETLRGEREHDRAAVAELSQLLARLDVDGVGEDEAGEPLVAEEEAPGSVLEAVRRAADTARHLRFAPRAFETAEDSPFRRPGLVLRALRQLDELAGRYAEGDMGRSLSQAAQDVGITQWKAGVSELARTRWRDDYLVAIDGREVELGPHVGLGSGSGAGFVARIYLHVADGNDELPRGITVGVVGRHLPDTTT
jgi:nucleoid-associated protein YgaU